MSLRSASGSRAPDLLGSEEPTRSGRAAVPRAVRRLRQRVLLWRRPLAALLAVAAVLAVLRASAEPVVESREVLVAGSDLAAGGVLEPEDLVAEELPASAVPSGVTEPADVAALVGRVLAAPVRRGEPVTDVRLVAPGILAGYPGLAAVPLRVADAGVVRLLRVGDRVDLVATRADGAGTSVAASRVPVLALPRTDGDVGAGVGGGLGGGLGGGGLVVVAVPERAAPALASRAVTSVLSVVLRQ